MTVVRHILFCVSLLFFIVACHLKPQPPLKVGTNVWPGYELFYLARNLGYFHNTLIRMVELPSATEVSHAFRNHLLDVAALTLDEALSLAQYDSDIRILLVIDISHGGDVLLAKPTLTSLTAIKGKRVGVENVAVGAILLDGALTAAKLTAADIQIVPLSVDEHLAAYQANKIDAVVTFEPIKTQLQQLGAISLFDSSQIPNRIVDVLVTRQSVITQRPNDLKQLLTAYFKALIYFKTQPKSAIVKMMPRLKATSTQIAAQFNGLIFPDLIKNQQLLAGQSPVLKKSIQDLVNLMSKQHLLFTTVKTDNLINSSFLPLGFKP